MKLSQKIESIVTDTLELYRDNFKLFISLAFLTALPGFLLFLFLGASIYSSTTNLVVFCILAIPVYYLAIRFSIALLIAIHSRVQGKEITLSQSFTTAKKHFWTYFLTSLKLGLIAIAPFLVVTLFAAIMPMRSIQLILQVFIGIGVAWFLIFNGFAPLISIFRPEKDSYFEYSQKLVSSNFILVIALCALSLLLQLFIYLICEYLLAPVGVYYGLGEQIVDLIFNTFSIPIFSGAYLLLFLSLVAKVEPNDNNEIQISQPEPPIE